MWKQPFEGYLAEFWSVQVPRCTFEWEDNFKSVQQKEPPLPVNPAARAHTPNAYNYDKLSHPLIVEARKKRPT